MLRNVLIGFWQDWLVGLGAVVLRVGGGVGGVMRAVWLTKRRQRSSDAVMTERGAE